MNKMLGIEYEKKIVIPSGELQVKFKYIMAKSYININYIVAVNEDSINMVNGDRYLVTKESMIKIKNELCINH